MNKCLVTKLNGSSDNTNLLKIGEMRVLMKKVDSPDKNSRGIQLIVNKEANLGIIGDGYFTDETFTENKGRTFNVQPNTLTKVYVSNTDCELSIPDKYSLVTFIDQATSGNPLQKNKEISNIDIFKYSYNLTNLNIANSSISGDIKDLKSLSLLDTLVIPYTNVTGNINSLISCTKLRSVLLVNTKEPFVGDMGSFKNASNLKNISIKNAKLYGDLATLPASLRFASFDSDRGSSFTWSSRPSSANIIAIEGNANLTNIDKMLQDQAQCQVGFTSSDSVYYKTISVAGNRTSASDDAVATLQQKGYTISIAKA